MPSRLNSGLLLPFISVAILKKQLNLEVRLHSMLQTLSVTLLETKSLREALLKSRCPC